MFNLQAAKNILEEQRLLINRYIPGNIFLFLKKVFIL